LEKSDKTDERLPMKRAADTYRAARRNTARMLVKLENRKHPGSTSFAKEWAGLQSGSPMHDVPVPVAKYRPARTKGKRYPFSSTRQETRRQSA
jgi:hypothetical protein